MNDWLIEHGVRILLIIVISTLSVFLLRLVTRIISKRIQAIDHIENSEFDRRTATLFWVLNNTGMILIVTVAILMILKEVDIDVTPVLASAGVVGLAVGFGAQTLIKDVISGLFILIEDQYQMGETIIVNGITGVVEKLSLRSSLVRGFDGTLHVIPNGDIRTVSNKTRDWGRAIVDVGVGANEDLEQALEALQLVGDRLYEDELWQGYFLERPSVTGVESLDDWSNRIRLIAKIKPGTQSEVERQIRLVIHREFTQKGISLPYPRQEIQIIS